MVIDFFSARIRNIHSRENDIQPYNRDILDLHKSINIVFFQPNTHRIK